MPHRSATFGVKGVKLPALTFVVSIEPEIWINVGQTLERIQNKRFGIVDEVFGRHGYSNRRVSIALLEVDSFKIASTR